jgi:hypothetical protein
MKKLTPLFFAFAVIASPLAASAQSVTVIINGEPMSFAQPPIVRAGRVFVPLRGVFERLGASVVYASGQINATGRGRTISLNIGSNQATVNGQPEVIDVAPFVITDTTYVPLRFVSQALGASVNWNDSTSTVTIVGGAPGPYPARPPYPPPQAPPPYAVRLVTVSPTGTVYGRNQAISFGFDHPVRLAALRVRVDGSDVTSGVTQSGRTFYVALPGPLSRGPHHVRVTGTTRDGVPFDLSWDFVRG